ncbi:glycoside hydrolase family 6 protein [Streptomyces sp. ME19-01-6]|uniref:glycoside hydrolase family 6 protein n=1 Tax=Streptomyces sp. ME19-01-6 TaxID=3028686 RepID=UPI0039F4B97B
MRRRRTIPTKPMAVLAAIALPLSTAAAGYAAAPGEPSPTRALHRLYTPPTGTGPYHQVTRLVRHGDRGAAAGLLAMVHTPHAVWFGDESPEEVEELIRQTTRRAVRRGRVPVLALYNTPGRDCGSYSAGGAEGTAEYREWIDAVARGIGRRRALIVLEPDSLALLPSDCGRAGGAGAGREEVFAGEFEGKPDGASDGGDAGEGDAFDSRLFGAGAGVLGGALARAEAQAEAQVARESGTRAAAPADIDPVTDLPEEAHADTPGDAPGDAHTDAPAEPGTPAYTPARRPTAYPAGKPFGDPTDRPTGNATDEPVSKPTDATTATTPHLQGPSTDAPGKAPALAPMERRARNAARYAELNYAVDTLEPLPGTKVYLDAGHAGWHSVNNIVRRLLQAGVDHATGFAINVSHYQTDEDNSWYGRLISSCLAYVADGGDPVECPDQRWPRLRAERWLEINVLNEPEEMKHFVTDTSRNGRGPWIPRAGSHADPQSWCNPPSRGLGIRPTTQTGDPLQDAALWVKTPGESDGQCLRGTAGPHDPERGTVDPEAGEWFPEQALELVRFAHPSL